MAFSPGLGVAKRVASPALVGAAALIAGTKEPKARLRMTEYRGVVSATMIYDALPIHDVFRRVDDETVIGAMDLRGHDRPYFFFLRREERPGNGRAIYRSFSTDGAMMCGDTSRRSISSSRAVILSTLARWRCSMEKFSVTKSRPGQKVQMFTSVCQAPQ